MSIGSALHGKRNEIAAMIAAYEARIEAARMDLAALDQAARLFASEDASDEPAIYEDLRTLGKLDGSRAADRELWQSEPPLAVRRLGPPGAEAEGSDDENSGPTTSPQLTGKLAYFATQPAEQQAPEEFFYLNWP
jgi:hypothetical protein